MTMNRRRSLAQRRLSIASAAYSSDETYLIKRGWDISMPRRVHRVECVWLAYAAMDVCRKTPRGAAGFPGSAKTTTWRTLKCTFSSYAPVIPGRHLTYWGAMSDD